MGVIFGNHLRARREEYGVSNYRISQLTGISHANLIAVEKGRRPPSPAVLEALASVPELAVTMDELLLWLDLDKLGEDGLERIRRYLERT